MKPAWQPVLFKPQFYSYSPLSIVKFFLILTVLFYPLLTDCMATDAPLKPAGKRVITVAKDGSGDYTTIQKAIKVSQPGDTIQVKDGIYDGRVVVRVNGTRTEPIALVNYPGHNPIIRPGGNKPVNKITTKDSFKIDGDWIIIDGLEVTNGWQFKINNADHLTLRRMYIHHMVQSNIFIGGSGNTEGNILIEDSTIANSGQISFIKPDEHPRLNHGIYISKNINCTTIKNITIWRNILQNNTGFSIKMTDHSCGAPGGPKDIVVANNFFLNNGNGIVIGDTSAKGNNITVHNNIFIFKKLPIEYNGRSMLALWKGTRGNTIKNNFFYSTRSDIRAIWSNDIVNSNNNVDHNVWYVTNGNWVWSRENRTDFRTKYKSTTGWDTNGSELLSRESKFIIDTTDLIFGNLREK